jgi:hypothetical protein
MKRFISIMQAIASRLLNLGPARDYPIHHSSPPLKAVADASRTATGS